jgi:hypothetical protein
MEETEDMSDETIHHESMIGTHFDGSTSSTSVSWLKVTCGACKLERPMEPAKEYEIPAHVLKTDERLSLADRTERAQRVVELARETEDAALQTVQHWTNILDEARELRERAEKRLSGLVRAQDGSAVPSAEQRGAEPHRASQGVLASLPAALTEAAETFGNELKQHAENFWGELTRHAPVNAVDIRTDVEETEGMTNLSEHAQSALLSAETSAQGSVPKNLSCRDSVELYEAGLIGSKGHLTRKGSIARQKLVQAREDAAFG